MGYIPMENYDYGLIWCCWWWWQWWRRCGCNQETKQAEVGSSWGIWTLLTHNCSPYLSQSDIFISEENIVIQEIHLHNIDIVLQGKHPSADHVCLNMFLQKEGKLLLFFSLLMFYKGVECFASFRKFSPLSSPYCQFKKAFSLWMDFSLLQYYQHREMDIFQCLS